MSIIQSFKKTIAFFNELKKENLIKDYALIGGLALSAWVEPRTTKDIDLIVVISPEITWKDISSLIETRLHKKVAVQKGSRKPTIQEKLSFMEGQMEVDVISSKGFELALEAVEKAVPTKIFGKIVKVATPEFLILLKLLPFSMQDQIDIISLMKQADLKSLKLLADKHSLLPKLESIMNKKIITPRKINSVKQ